METNVEKKGNILRLWTIKSPTESAFISHKGNSYQAIEIAEGVKIINKIFIFKFQTLII